MSSCAGGRPRSPSGSWAIESAGGLGYLLAQQLVAAGEEVVDVPATLAARVRVLGTGRSNKNDPNDGRSVAVAALRAPSLPWCRPLITVRCCDCWRNGTSTSAGNGTGSCVGCMRCCASSCAGGIAQEIRLQAEELLHVVTPAAVKRAQAMALERVEDIRRVDGQIADIQRRIHDAVVASKTPLTELYGVGPVDRRAGDRLHRRRHPLREL